MVVLVKLWKKKASTSPKQQFENEGIIRIKDFPTDVAQFYR